MRAAVAVVALVACGRSKHVDNHVEVPRAGDAAIADVAIARAADAHSSIDAQVTDMQVKLAAAPELVTAVVDSWDSTQATLRLWQHDDHGWRAVGEPWPAAIGGAGLAWGDGVHGNGAPAGRTGPIKHEGDRKSPAGAFAIRGVYGYATRPPAGTKLPYTPVEHGWQCVDDPASSHYTQILDRRTTRVDWGSAEEMRRDDELYTWVVDIAHNSARVAGSGSCIFFHVWSGPGSTTVGCTAMDEPRLAKLIGQLEPSAVYVLLPRAEYAALAGPWGLPAL